MIKLRDLSNTIFYFSIILLLLYGYTIDNVSAQADSGENTDDNPTSSKSSNIVILLTKFHTHIF